MIDEQIYYFDGYFELRNANYEWYANFEWLVCRII